MTPLQHITTQDAFVAPEIDPAFLSRDFGEHSLSGRDPATHESRRY